jgi:hypothetical protein
MIPGEVSDRQTELEVFGLDVDVDVPHHVDKERYALVRQGDVLAGSLLSSFRRSLKSSLQFEEV